MIHIFSSGSHHQKGNLHPAGSVEVQAARYKRAFSRFEAKENEAEQKHMNDGRYWQGIGFPPCPH